MENLSSPSKYRHGKSTPRKYLKLELLRIFAWMFAVMQQFNSGIIHLFGSQLIILLNDPLVISLHCADQWLIDKCIQEGYSVMFYIDKLKLIMVGIRSVGLHLYCRCWKSFSFVNMTLTKWQNSVSLKPAKNWNNVTQKCREVQKKFFLIPFVFLSCFDHLLFYWIFSEDFVCFPLFYQSHCNPAKIFKNNFW